MIKLHRTNNENHVYLMCMGALMAKHQNNKTDEKYDMYS